MQGGCQAPLEFDKDTTNGTTEEILNISEFLYVIKVFYGKILLNLTE